MVEQDIASTVEKYVYETNAEFYTGCTWKSGSQSLGYPAGDSLGCRLSTYSN